MFNSTKKETKNKVEREFAESATHAVNQSTHFAFCDESSSPLTHNKIKLQLLHTY